MIPVEIVAIISLFYFGLLFAVAYYADKKRKAGKSIISNATIYSLSLAVYHTSWTFYGSVGRAATIGLDFLADLPRPDPYGLRLVVSAAQNGARQQRTQYRQHRRLHFEPLRQIGNFLGGHRHHLPVIGIMPYIALQLKAVSHTFDLLSASAEPVGRSVSTLLPAASARYRHGLYRRPLPGALRRAVRRQTPWTPPNATRAWSPPSPWNPLSNSSPFSAVGIFVTYGHLQRLFRHLHQVRRPFSRSQLSAAAQHPADPLHDSGSRSSFISMMAFMFLPRQFHIMVIENSNEEHIQDAMWRLSRLHAS